MTAKLPSNEESISRKWLAAYTSSRHESRVALQLQQKSIPILLPVSLTYRRWSDRIQRIRKPLFPGYVFVHVSDSDRALVLQTSGVVNIVSSGGRPCRLRDDDLAVLQRCVASSDGVEPHPYLKVGQKVGIRYGPFAGCEGILVEKKNSTRVVITVEQIMQSIAINVHLADIEAVA